MDGATQAEMSATMNEIGTRARNAFAALSVASSASKDACLRLCAEKIRARTAEIINVNAQDLAKANEKNLRESFIDRMTLTPDRIEGIASALEDIATQEDPIGKVDSEWTRPNGLRIARVKTAIGVIGVIYESRPNVTIDAAAIAIKAGNAVILRGGSDCLETAKALFACFRDALIESGLPEHAAQLVTTTDRAAVGEMLAGLNGAIDLVIPRGGKSLVARVQSEAKTPVLSHLDGICHVYVDRDADITIARDIVLNSKMRRTGICGAAETLLIDKKNIEEAWPQIGAALKDAGCAIRGDETLCAIDPSIERAGEDDWTTEYLAAIISVAVVDGVEGAIDHIRQYSSSHTESIVTENDQTARIFLNRVDSAIVMHNTSTQFADGGEFGLGAEIGIATGRMSPRGPVGVNELTTYKNIVFGDGQTRP